MTSKNDGPMLTGFTLLSMGFIIIPVAIILFICSFIFGWNVFETDDKSTRMLKSNGQEPKDLQSPIASVLVCPKCETSQKGSHCTTCRTPTVTMDEFLEQEDWA